MKSLRSCVSLVVATFALSSCSAPPPQTVLLQMGATWAYLADGSDQGTVWQTADFDDSQWSRGPAELGYGDGDESTTVPSGTDNAKFVTTYFRSSFVMDDLSQFSSLSGELVYDDGAVVYLNGTEVFRINMPAGPVGFTTLAVEAAEFEPKRFSVPLEHAKAGTNVVAVEIHQADTSSSDISFDLRLAGDLIVSPGKD